jgi:hypothetical protein
LSWHFRCTKNSDPELVVDEKYIITKTPELIYSFTSLGYCDLSVVAVPLNASSASNVSYQQTIEITSRIDCPTVYPEDGDVVTQTQAFPGELIQYTVVGASLGEPSCGLITEYLNGVPNGKQKSIGTNRDICQSYFPGVKYEGVYKLTNNGADWRFYVKPSKVGLLSVNATVVNKVSVTTAFSDSYISS